MTNLEITVHVNLGVTPELTALVNAILHKESQPVVAASSEPAPEAVLTRKLQSVQAAPKAPDEKSAAPEPAPAEDEKPKELTGEDVRAAMHRTRTRIEGEDYKGNTDGDLYKKYHKPLTATFKNISALLGADKPSALPADKRESFITQCDELLIGDDGTITTKSPF